jgi:hypothetical protein
MKKINENKRNRNEAWQEQALHLAENVMSNDE